MQTAPLHTVKMPAVACSRSLVEGAFGSAPVTVVGKEDKAGSSQITAAAVEKNNSLPSRTSFSPSSRMIKLENALASPTFQRTLGSVMVTAAIEEVGPALLGEKLEMAAFVQVGHKLADAAGEIIRLYFRTRFDIITKDDSSPVTIADRAAEEAMSSIIKEYLPSHGIYGEEYGLYMPDGGAEYVWVLDPIDGTKSFVTGKPLFGTLIALVHKGVPILGIIDQPVLGERWIGLAGEQTTLNGVPIASRSSCKALKDAFLYTTSPHLFAGVLEEAFIRVRDKVKTPLYGCDCYAYGLLAAGHVDLVVESGLKPYDFLALIPVIEGAGGSITDWSGKKLSFWPNSDYPSCNEAGMEILAAGSPELHREALDALKF